MIFFSEVGLPRNKELAGWKKFRYIDTSKNDFQSGNERFGNKYMCKFFAYDVYEYLKDEYDYYLRCDTDCYIKTLNYDIFQWTKDNNVEYGFAMRKLEAHKPTRDTLPIWTQKYITKSSIIPTALMDKELNICFNFHNSFHIGKVSFFLFVQMYNITFIL